MPEAPEHSRDAWAGRYLADRRPILSAMLPPDDPAEVPAPFQHKDGWTLERFERPGEMAMLPYLRVTKDGVTFEAPLSRFAWVSFGEEPI